MVIKNKHNCKLISFNCKEYHKKKNQKSNIIIGNIGIGFLNHFQFFFLFPNNNRIELVLAPPWIELRKKKCLEGTPI